jgi:hypothetical protein
MSSGRPGARVLGLSFSAALAWGTSGCGGGEMPEPVAVFSGPYRFVVTPSASCPSLAGLPLEWELLGVSQEGGYYLTLPPGREDSVILDLSVSGTRIEGSLCGSAASGELWLRIDHGIASRGCAFARVIGQAIPRSGGVSVAASGTLDAIVSVESPQGSAATTCGAGDHRWVLFPR